jgi:hypothetical protein
MSEVYLAYDARAERPVVVKLMRPEQRSDPELRDRFAMIPPAMAGNQAAEHFGSSRRVMSKAAVWGIVGESRWRPQWVLSSG